MKKTLLLLIAVLSFTVFYGQINYNENVENFVKPFDIQNLNGEPFNTSEIDNGGNPILIITWGTWLKNGTLFLDDLLDWEFDTTWRETGVKVYVALAHNARTINTAKDYIQKKGWKFEFLIDTSKVFLRSINYSNNGWSECYLVDGLGTLVKKDHCDRDYIYDWVDAIKSATTRDFVETKEKAESGDADAQFQLCFFYLEGNGIIQDTQKAKYWLEQAAKNGHKDAEMILKGIPANDENENQ